MAMQTENYETPIEHLCNDWDSLNQKCIWDFVCPRVEPNAEHGDEMGCNSFEGDWEEDNENEE